MLNNINTKTGISGTYLLFYIFFLQGIIFPNCNSLQIDWKETEGGTKGTFELGVCHEKLALCLSALGHLVIMSYENL